MTAVIRPAGLSDLDRLVLLLVADAEDRCSAGPGLWRLDRSALARTRSSIGRSMEAGEASIRQRWLVAEGPGRLLGVIHSMLLPVPPIYAGEFGPPGLIMEGSFVAPGAPSGTRQALLEAAEADLIAAGARVLLASSVTGGAWEADFAAHGYDPLTAYFAKTGLGPQVSAASVRPARPGDVPGIVAASAAHRSVLDQLHHPFWKPHDDADARFGAWMTRSLTLGDRDMFVCGEGDGVCGYAISQPATAMHVPAPHDHSGIGMIDDFHHAALEDPEGPGGSDPVARDLLAAAEAARARRGAHSVLVVCPARWRSKIELLERQGYHRAITWRIRMVD